MDEPYTDGESDARTRLLQGTETLADGTCVGLSPFLPSLLIQKDGLIRGVSRTP